VHRIFPILLGGMGYTLVIGEVLYLNPQFIGMSRESLQNKVLALVSKVTGGKRS
jgi:hypothetical protein